MTKAQRKIFNKCTAGLKRESAKIAKSRDRMRELHDEMEEVIRCADSGLDEINYGVGCIETGIEQISQRV